MKKSIIILAIFLAGINFASASWLDDFFTFFKPRQTTIFGAGVYLPIQGGTGINSAVVGDVNKCLIVSDDSPFTYTLGACSTDAGEANTGSSLGTGLNLFDSKSGVDLRFNTLSAGTNITLSTTSNNNTIVINNAYGDSNVNSYIHASTTIPKTYIANTFTGLQSFSNTGTTTFSGGLSTSGLLANDFIETKFINATSTTATSTFIGGVTMASGAGNVGIGSLSPLEKLYTAGNTQTTGEFIEGTGSIVSTAALIPYIQLSSTANQVPANTAETLVTFTNADEQQTFTFSPTSGTITTPEDGVYVVIVGGQSGKTSGATLRTVDMWIKKNDVDVPRSSVRTSMKEADATQVVIQNSGLRLSAGDTIKVYIAVSSAADGAGLYATTPGVGPVIPSIIFTMFKISQ